MRISLFDEFLGSHESLLEVTLPVLDSKGTNVAVTVEPLLVMSMGRGEKVTMMRRATNRVILDERGELRVWHDSVECPVNLVRNDSFKLKVLDLALVTAWFHKTLELRTLRIA